MSKYLITWEVDMSRWPTDPKELGALVIKMGEMVKQDMKEGKTTDWGEFVGGGKGYAVGEGNALDVYKGLQRYSPYVTFKVHQALSIDEVMEVVKSMME